MGQIPVFIRFACSDYLLKIFRCYHAANIMYKAVHNLAHLTFPPSVNLAHGGTHSSHPYKFRPLCLISLLSLIQSRYGTA